MVSSYALLYENSKNPYTARREAIKAFINNNSAEYLSPDNHKKVSSKAKEIMKEGIKYKDALHVASAIIADCDYMLTTDIRLLKYKTDEIKLCNPVDFVTEMEGNEND